MDFLGEKVFRFNDILSLFPKNMESLDNENLRLLSSTNPIFFSIVTSAKGKKQISLPIGFKIDLNLSLDLHLKLSKNGFSWEKTDKSEFILSEQQKLKLYGLDRSFYIDFKLFNFSTIFTGKIKKKISQISRSRKIRSVAPEVNKGIVSSTLTIKQPKGKIQRLKIEKKVKKISDFFSGKNKITKKVNNQEDSDMMVQEESHKESQKNENGRNNTNLDISNCIDIINIEN